MGPPKVNPRYACDKGQGQTPYYCFIIFFSNHRSYQILNMHRYSNLELSDIIFAYGNASFFVVIMGGVGHPPPDAFH